MAESIVLELQAEVMKSDCDVVNTLRKAHVIATKLNLNELNAWILCELNGYKDGDNIPDYRIVHGTLKAFNPVRGWIPAIIPNDEIEQAILENKMPNSIPEILSLLKNSENGLTAELPGSTQEMLNKNARVPMHLKLFISRAAVEAIVEKVKNVILEWTLKLESEGILGEGMRFSDEEKASANLASQITNNFYATASVISAESDAVQIVVGDQNTLSFNYEEAQKTAKEISDAIREDKKLSAEDRTKALELLSDISAKIGGKEKPSIIKSSLDGLKDFLINTGANLAAAYVQLKFQGIL